MAGFWIAKRDFAFKNLMVKRGHKLPDEWQYNFQIRWLKHNYGDTCVQLVSDDEYKTMLKKSQPELSPVPKRKRGRPKKVEASCQSGVQAG